MLIRLFTPFSHLLFKPDLQEELPTPGGLESVEQFPQGAVGATGHK